MGPVDHQATPPDALHDPLLQLQAITAQLSATLPQEDILRKAFLLRYVIPCVHMGSVVLLDANGQVSTSVTTLDNDDIQNLVPPEFVPYLSRAILRRRQPVLIENVPDHPGLASFWLPEQRQEMNTIWAIPLIENVESTLGFILFLFDRPFQPSAELSTTVVLFASHLVATLRQAQLFEEAKAKSEQEQRLRILGESLHGGSSLAEMLAAAPNSIAHALGFDYCTILLREEGESNFSERGGFPPGSPEPVPLPPGSPLIQQTTHTDEVTVVTEGALCAAADDSYIRGRGFRSFMAAPLELQGEVRALLLVGSPFPRSIRLETLELFRSVLTQLGSEFSRVLAHERTVQEREKFEAVFQNVSDGIILFDTEGKIAACNAAMLSLMGWENANAIGLHYSRAFSPRHQELVRVVDKITSSGAPLAYQEGTIKRRNGRIVDVSINGVPISSPGKHQYTMLMVRDISHNKAIDRMKSEFISTVSHELRTPLTAVKGYATTMLHLADELSEDQKRRYLLGIDRGANRLTRLVNDILLVTSIEADRFNISRQPTDVEELVSSLVEEMQEQEPQHRFQLFVQKPVPIVTVDKDKIEQVLLNLLSNALKYSPEDTLIEVRVRSVDGDSRLRPDLGRTGREASPDSLLSLVISVTDQGVGIPEEHFPHLFTKFYRVDSSLTRTTSGTGLGLYISKVIVEAHGGRIWAQSTPGKGSSFHFSLPLQG